MADIPIERKDNRSIWPWIIGIIVLLLILWFLFGRHRNDNTAATTGADTVMTTPAPATGAGAVGTPGAAGATGAGMNGAPATTGAPGATGTATPGTTTPGTTTPGTTTPGTTTPGSTTPGTTP